MLSLLYERQVGVSVCLFVKPFVVARQLFGEHVPAQRSIAGRVVSYVFHVVSQASRRLTLPRTSCFKMRKAS
jgi:hypothetical protein